MAAAAAQARPRQPRGNPAPTEASWGVFVNIPLDYWTLGPAKLGTGLLREVVGQTLAYTQWDPRYVHNRSNEYSVPVHSRIAKILNTTVEAVQKAYKEAVKLGVLETSPHDGRTASYKVNLKRLRELPDRPNTRSGNVGPRDSAVEELLQLDEIAEGSRRRPKAKNQKCPDGKECRVKDFVLLANGSVKFGEVAPAAKTAPSKPPGSASIQDEYPNTGSGIGPRAAAARDPKYPNTGSGIAPVTSIASTKHVSKDAKALNVWERVKEALASKLSPEGYQNWIARTEFVGVEDGLVQVAVPNKPTRSWLEDEYASQIAAALRPLGFSRVKYQVVPGAHLAEPEPETEPAAVETIEAMTEMLEALVPLRLVGGPLPEAMAKRVWEAKGGAPFEILHDCVLARVEKFTKWGFAISLAEDAAKVWAKRRRRAAGG